MRSRTAGPEVESVPFTRLVERRAGELAPVVAVAPLLAQRRPAGRHLANGAPTLGLELSALPSPAASAAVPRPRGRRAR